MNILGISAFYHDSAAALLQNGKIIAAAQEERFTRKKHDSSFPVNAVNFCLQYAGVRISDIDAIAFYDKPLLKFERLLETYYAFAPKGLVSFLQSMPVWMREKLFLKRVIHEELENISGYKRGSIKLLFPEHHLSHAASAFYSSPFHESAILTIDGVGEWATASICKGSGKNIEILKELHFPHSVGLLYSAFTYYLGFKVNSGEYKMMGLAPYGNPDSEQTKSYIKIIKEVLCDIRQDGSLQINQDYFNYATRLRMVHDDKWEKHFGFKKREPEQNIEAHHSNLACAIQLVTEEIVIKMASEAKRLTGSKNLCMAGGVALNCVANGQLNSSGLFDEIFIQPASGDAGGALGAAQAAYHIYFAKERLTDGFNDDMQGSFLGPDFSKQEIKSALLKNNAVYDDLSDTALLEKTAELLKNGNVVGWFQGRMEFGPRALGNRSILGDARNEAMQKKMNLKIKFREGFRPFAPCVLEEDVQEYFDLKGKSPYMLLVAKIKEKHRASLPDNYKDSDISQQLYTKRSNFQSITHVDFSARIQTVSRNTNQRLWELLSRFKEMTGAGMLINTSFNVRGEPPVCTPDDAYRCFMRTGMDALIIGNYLLVKSNQPVWHENEEWKNDFTLD